MSDYPAIEALHTIGQTGSFDLAARALGVTPGAISQRISGFEDRIGAILVHRSTPAKLTPTGDRLARHFSDVRLLEQGLTDVLAPPQARPTLRIAVNADSIATWALPAFAQMPEVLFDFEIDDQDHSDRWLREGAVSAAITARAAPVRGCDVTPLGALPYLAVATPAFAAEHFPDGVTSENLKRAPALIFNRKDRLQHTWASRHLGPAPRLQMHFLPSTHDITAAIRLGLGWGLNPASLFADDIAVGRLVPLDDTPLLIPLFWQTARLSKDALSPLTQAIKRAAKAALVQDFSKT